MFNTSLTKKRVKFSVLGKSLVVGFKQEKLCFSFFKERLDMNPLGSVHKSRDGGVADFFKPTKSHFDIFEF